MTEETNEETGICPFDDTEGCDACILGGPCPLGKTVDEITEKMKQVNGMRQGERA